MTTSTRLLAASTAASFLLSATPAAAHGLHIGVDTHAKTSVNTNVANVNSDVKVKTDVNGFKNFGQLVKSLRADAKADAKANVSAETKVSLYTRWKDAAIARVKVAINGVGSAAKRLCNAQHDGDQNAITACVNRAKADFSASITAMIDAAFKI